MKWYPYLNRNILNKGTAVCLPDNTVGVVRKSVIEDNKKIYYIFPVPSVTPTSDGRRLSRILRTTNFDKSQYVKIEGSEIKRYGSNFYM